ncbi:MAG: signal peptidase II [Deltaproteobacteria bacterium]|nr:signal peptidase II [Deltaproteobacteria bacterium]
MKKNLGIFAAIALSVAVIDQAAKAVIAGRFAYSESVPVIRGVFNLVYYGNPGAAFSILASGGALRTVFLAGASIAALVIIGFMARQAASLLQNLSLALIAGGAVGNLIDRVRLGYVVDFLDFQAGAYHWPAFNAADTAITVGVGLAVYSYYLRPGR